MTDPYLHRAYLESKWCEDLMETHLDENSDRFNLADHPVSESFKFRSQQMVHIKTWKWLCNWQNRKFLFKLIFSDKRGIDFGGALSPAGGNAEIIDIVGGHRGIDAIGKNQLDYIYTSHCLEHVPNLDETLVKLYNKLKLGGIIYVAVPRYTCIRWRAGTIPKHVWTFSLEDGKFTRIDRKLEKAGFVINKAEYAWDDSIVLIGEKDAKT